MLPPYAAVDVAGSFTSTMAIKLNRGLETIVDAADYAELSQYKWRAWWSVKRFYVCRTEQVDGARAAIQMHRQILGVTDRWTYVDHRDGDSLNNTRANIRTCSQQENIRNTRVARGISGYKGVTTIKRREGSIYQACIYIGAQQINLGTFNDPVDAARAYDEAAEKYFGEFAATNAALGLIQSENLGPLVRRAVRPQARTNMKRLADQTGIAVHTLYERWHRGDRDERLTRPISARHELPVLQRIITDAPF